MPKKNGLIITKDAGKEATDGGEKAKDQKKMLPPDGGWGWVVVSAFALNYFVSVPMMQSFGLIFKDTFRKLNMSATDSTTILNVSSALTFGLGLVNGPLLRRFSYRKVALFGSVLLFIGITTTSFANSFTFFIITYSVITASGFCFIGAAFSLAMNSYFRKRRGRATGLGMTATGLGPVLMPLFISYLLKEYAVQGTMIIMGGLSLHSLVASLLLQPVRWHMKPAPPTEEDKVDKTEKKKKKKKEENENQGEKVVVEVGDSECAVLNEENHKDMPIARRKRTNTMNSIEHDLDSQSIYGFDAPLVNPSHPERSYHRRCSSEIPGDDPKRWYARSVSQDGHLSRTHWWNSAETINLGSCIRIFDERQQYTQLEKVPDNVENNNLSADAKIKKKGNVFKRALTCVARFFFLELLKDPVYVNIMLGMSSAIFGEINFSLLTPFILNDFQFTTDEVALVMSITAGVDITFRFLVPFVGEKFKFHPRVMYLFSLSLLISSRTLLIYYNSLSSVIAIAVFLGVAKGIRTVYMTLVIPTYVPLEKLPGASGIQMLVNGLFFGALGPLLGLLRDYTGSYVTCIYFVNVMTFFTILTWTIEMMITRKGLIVQI